MYFLFLSDDPHLFHPASLFLWQDTRQPHSLSPIYFVFFIRFHCWQKHNAPHLRCWLKMALSVPVSLSLISSCLLVLFSPSPLPCSPSSPHVPYPIFLYSSSLLPSSRAAFSSPLSFILSFSLHVLSTLLSLLPPPVSFPLPLTHHYSVLSPPFLPFSCFSSSPHLLIFPHLPSSLPTCPPLSSLLPLS